MKLKKEYKLCFVVLAVIFLYAPSKFVMALAAPTQCQIIDGKISDANNSICLAEPKNYVARIYELGICRVEPGAPTSSTKLDMSNCSAMFKSETGELVTVGKDKTLNLPASLLVSPKDDNYGYAYAILAPTIEISSEFRFQTNRTPKYLNSGPGVGQYCWTTTGTVYSYDSPRSDMPFNCGENVPTSLGIVKNHINSFSGSSPQYSMESTASGNTYKAHLLTSDLKLASTADTGSFGNAGTGVERLFGVSPLPSIVNWQSIARLSPVLSVVFKVTNGATIVPDSNNGNVKTLYGIYSGPPSLRFSVLYIGTN